MAVLRARSLAFAFILYFGVLGYLAYATARLSKGIWYTADTSRVVYQTTMVGGILVLVGLIVIASILPSILRASRSRGFPTRPPSLRPEPLSRSRLLFPNGPSRLPRAEDSTWSIDNLVSETRSEPSGHGDSRREQDAAAVSAALSRLMPGADTPTPANLMDRLSGIRARNGRLLLSEDREMTDVLVRLVNEIKPLLLAAKRAGLNVPEIRRVVATATAGREGDLEYRVRIVEQLKDTLEASLVERIAQDLQNVLVDIERTKSASHQIHSAEQTAAEGVALLDAGNYVAALDRIAKARAAVGGQMAMTSPGPNYAGPLPTGAVSIGPLVGPSIIASLYVGISAMLLPGVAGFLETNFMLNTGVILFLSYGWFALILYALASVYLLASSSSFEAWAGEPPSNEG